MYFEGEKVLINDANDFKANLVGYSKFYFVMYGKWKRNRKTCSGYQKVEKGIIFHPSKYDLKIIK